MHFSSLLDPKGSHASGRGYCDPVSCMSEELTGCPRALGLRFYNLEAFLFFQAFYFVLTML